MKNIWKLVLVTVLIISSPLSSQELSEKEIKLQLHKIKSGKLYGSYSEYSKYLQLEGRCKILGNTKNESMKKLISDLLLSEIMNYKVVEEKPTNWGSLTMDMKGGNIGALSSTYLKINGEQGFYNVYNLLLKKEDTLKMKMFFKQMMFYNLDVSHVKYNEFLMEQMKEVKSPEMREVIKLYLQRRREFEKERKEYKREHKEATEKEINNDLAKIKSGELYGNYSEFDKFRQLEKIAKSLEKTAEKKLVLNFLLLEMANLKVVEEIPTNWNNYLIDLSGGNLGVLIYTYLKISDEQGFSNVYNAIIKTEDPIKLKIFLKTVLLRTKIKHEAFLNEEKEKVKSEKMREVIDQHLAKMAKEREKFENSMQGRIQRERERKRELDEKGKNKKQKPNKGLYLKDPKRL